MLEQPAFVLSDASSIASRHLVSAEQQSSPSSALPDFRLIPTNYRDIIPVRYSHLEFLKEQFKSQLYQSRLTSQGRNGAELRLIGEIECSRLAEFGCIQSIECLKTKL